MSQWIEFLYLDGMLAGLLSLLLVSFFRLKWDHQKFCVWFLALFIPVFFLQAFLSYQFFLFSLFLSQFFLLFFSVVAAAYILGVLIHFNPHHYRFVGFFLRGLVCLVGTAGCLVPVMSDPSIFIKVLYILIIFALWAMALKYTESWVLQNHENIIIKWVVFTFGLVFLGLMSQFEVIIRLGSNLAVLMILGLIYLYIFDIKAMKPYFWLPCISGALFLAGYFVASDYSMIVPLMILSCVFFDFFAQTSSSYLSHRFPRWAPMMHHGMRVLFSVFFLGLSIFSVWVIVFLM